MYETGTYDTGGGWKGSMREGSLSQRGEGDITKKGIILTQ